MISESHGRLHQNKSKTQAPAQTHQQVFIDSFGVVPRVTAYYQASLNICLVGPPGIGKTSLVLDLAGSRENLVTAVGNELMTPSELLGRFELTNGETVFQYGALVTAVEEGKTFYMDEINGLSSPCITTLHPLLDDRRELYIPSIKRTIRAHENFRFVASTNYSTSGLDLPREFRDRFVYVMMNRLDNATESKLLLDRYNIADEDCEFLVRYATVIRNMDKHGGTSTRQLENAAKAIERGVSRDHAAFDCLVISLAGSSRSAVRPILTALKAEGFDEIDAWESATIPSNRSPVFTEAGETWS